MLYGELPLPYRHSIQRSVPNPNGGRVDISSVDIDAISQQMADPVRVITELALRSHIIAPEN